MKTILVWLLVFWSCEISIRAQETASPSPAAGTEISKGYEVGEESVSPDGRFAILYPVRAEDSSDEALQPNVLVRLKPYSVLAEIGDEAHCRGMRGEPAAEWNGNSVVAIWAVQKWGMVDLAVYEIANDKVKRVQKVWPEVRKYFERDFKERFLKKYPKESDDFTFVSDGNGEGGVRELEFKGRKLFLNLFADNKPNLAGGPHWTAELRAVWNLDSVRFEKIDFRPGKISDRPWLKN